MAIIFEHAPVAFRCARCGWQCTSFAVLAEHIYLCCGLAISAPLADKSTAPDDPLVGPDGSEIQIAPDLAARNAEMCRLRRDGLTLAELAERYGMTRERARQITAGAVDGAPRMDLVHRPARPLASRARRRPAVEIELAPSEAVSVAPTSEEPRRQMAPRPVAYCGRCGVALPVRKMERCENCGARLNVRAVEANR